MHHQATPPNAARPKLPMAAPAASAPAACLPRNSPRMPGFLLALVLGDQCGSRRQDRGKGEKEAADFGAGAFGNGGGGGADQPAEYEAQQVLEPFRAGERAEIDFDDHDAPSRRKPHHRAKAAANQTGSETSAAASGCMRPRSSKRLSTAAYRPSAMAPKTRERHSRLAYILPCLAMVSPRLASASEGAALNRPAKLLGFRRSPINAKSDTTTPPIA